MQNVLRILHLNNINNIIIITIIIINIIMFHAIVYTEYAEKECMCDGTWFQKLPKTSKRGNFNNATTSTEISSKNRIISLGPKAMPLKRRGAEWTNYKTCR